MLVDIYAKEYLMFFGLYFGLAVVFAVVFVPIYFLWPAILESKPVTRFLFYYYPKGIDTRFMSAEINPYFQNLGEADRKKFAWRAYYFLDTTEIDFRGFQEYDTTALEKIKLLLAAVAAQMTLFLPEDCFKMFHTIIIYREPFRSPFVDRLHKGETNPGAGVIAFALTAIQEGIHDPKDGLNLILHEYAHALWLEHKLSSYQTFDIDAADSFEGIVEREFSKAQVHGATFFRDYGLTDIVEFIAVAIENFFERPDEFKIHYPELYASMTKLFRHDPAKLLQKGP
jgi:Mlc titration factor MtfA (ptsG expression regulator)